MTQISKDHSRSGSVLSSTVADSETGPRFSMDTAIAREFCIQIGPQEASGWVELVYDDECSSKLQASTRSYQHIKHRGNREEF